MYIYGTFRKTETIRWIRLTGTYKKKKVVETQKKCTSKTKTESKFWLLSVAAGVFFLKPKIWQTNDG